MLNKNELDIIEKYVDPKYFDKERLIYYLNTHQIIDHKIFAFVDNKIEGNEYLAKLGNIYPNYHNNLNSRIIKNGKETSLFRQISREKFIKRIPFYFYVKDFEVNEEINKLKGREKSIFTNEYMFGDLLDIDPYNPHMTDKETEEWWLMLEMMFYDFKIPLPYIFSYKKGKDFALWTDYLQLCKQFDYQNYLPRNFTFHYNVLLEKAGKPAIIYNPDYDPYQSTNYVKTSRKIVYYGTFPLDDAGEPIMEWIGLNIKNAKKIYATTEEYYDELPSITESRKREFEFCYLVVEFTNQTSIFQHYPNGEWYCDYQGPGLLTIDNEAIKYHRKYNNLTQKEVADIIEVSLRTYQKWEAGQTIPDGNSIIRLLQLFNITNPECLCN